MSDQDYDLEWLENWVHPDVVSLLREVVLLGRGTVVLQRHNFSRQSGDLLLAVLQLLGERVAFLPHRLVFRV